MAYSNSWINSIPDDPCAVTIAPNAGDIIIAWAITDTTNAQDLDSAPSGYTQITRQQSTADAATMLVAYKIATGAETSVSFSSASSNTCVAGAMTFSGRDQTTPLDVTPQIFNSSTTDTTADISITPVTDGCDLCFVYGDDTGSVNPSFTFSTTSGTTGTWTTRTDQNSGFYNIGVGDATQDTAGALTARGTVTQTGGRLSVLIALRPTPPAGQNSYPSSDITDGSWVPSAGTDLYATIDETALSDADYNYVESNSTMRVALSSVSTPDTGTRTLSYRIKGSAEKKAIARLIEGTTTVQTFTDDPIPETLTTKAQTVTNSISDYSNLRFELEIADATSAPTASVSFGAIGTGVNGSTSIATGYPASIAAGDLLVIVATTGATNSETPGTPSGWTSQGSYATTDGTFGVDTGPRRVTVFTKEATGSESGTVAVATTNGNTGRCTMSRFAKTYPSYTWDISATGGFYGPGTAVSVTGGSLAFAPGDVVVVSNAQRVDSVTQSSQSLTASGITFGTRTNRASTAVTTGNDIRHVIDTYAAITAGTATVAPTWSYTASASCSAAIHFLRLREVPPTEKARITWVKFNVPDVASGATISPADMAHAQIMDAAALVQAYILSIADLAHGNVMDGATLVQAHVLSTADLANAQALDVATITLSIALAPDDAANAQAIEATTLIQAHALTPADALNTQAMDGTTLVQQSVLAPADALNAQAIDPATLTQAHSLAPADLSNAQAMDVATLIQAHTLAIADITHVQTLENVTLAVLGNLSPADMMSAQSMDAPLLLQAHLLSPSDARNLQSIDAPTLVQSNVIVPAGMDHAVILDATALVQAHVLSAADLSHGNAMDGATLTVMGALSVADLLHSQAMDAAGIVQAHLLSPDDLSHTQSVDATTLVQAFILLPADLLHAQAMNGTLLDVAFSLTPLDLLHEQSFESSGLIQAHVIFPSDLLHANRFDVARILSGLLVISAGRAVIVGESDRYVLLTPSDRIILLTPSSRSILLTPSN